MFLLCSCMFVVLYDCIFYLVKSSVVQSNLVVYGLFVFLNYSFKQTNLVLCSLI